MVFVKDECKVAGGGAKKEGEERRFKRLTGVDTVLWKDAVVPYTFGPHFESEEMHGS